MEIVPPAGTRTSRNYAFTLFSYVWEDILFLLQITCRGIIFQEELCPTTNQPHLQGFIRFDKAHTFDEAKNKFGADRQHVHLEMARSPSACVEYCRKGETRFGECYEEGDLTFQQGKSSELADCYDLIAQGTTFRELVKQYPLQCILHPNGIRFAKQHTDADAQPKWRPITVYAITGPSGCGKTRSVYECFDGVYKLARPTPGQPVWFGSYDNHKVLLIDDFYGWIPYAQLLHILDGYPLELDVKGTQVFATYDTVILTSNSTPHDWYPSIHPDGCSAALARRIHHWIRPVVGEPEGFFTYEFIKLNLTTTPCPFTGPLPRVPTAVSRNWNEPFRPPRRSNGYVDLSTIPDIDVGAIGSPSYQQRSPSFLGSSSSSFPRPGNHAP